MARETKEHELTSPVDLPGTPLEGGHPLGWTTLTIGVAALTLLSMNAGTLSAWVDEKPVSEVQQRASSVAGAWKAAMDSIGLTGPREALHREWKRLQAARFGNEAAASGP